MERRHCPGVEILNFGGIIGDVDIIRLRDIFGQLSQTGRPRIVCNFYAVEDLSLAALGLFVRTRRECALFGGDLVLSQPSHEAEQIIRRLRRSGDAAKAQIQALMVDELPPPELEDCPPALYKGFLRKILDQF